MEKLKIIIVDDEELILKSMKEYFDNKNKYEIIVFKNPMDALEYIKKDKVHIALLDIQMPEINGIEMLREIKITDPLVQVIMMTAYSSIDRTIMAFELGANDYLIKPFKSMKHVEEIIDLTVGKFQRWKEIFKLSIKNRGKK